jgi:UDP-glucose 4-epimerase
MRILVTGGAGYIGSIVTEELVKDGHEVTVYDNLSKGYEHAIAPDARFVKGDLVETDRLTDRPAGNRHR